MVAVSFRRVLPGLVRPGLVRPGLAAEPVRPGGQQPPELLPGPHPLAQAADAHELVGRVQLLVGGREREEQGLDPEHPLEQGGGRERAGDAGLEHLLARVDRLQRGGGRPDGRVAGGDGVGRHPGRVGCHLDPHARRGLRGDVGDDRLDDVVGVLAGDQPGRDVANGDVRDDGVLPAAGDAVDLEGRPFPEALQRAEAPLAAGLGQAELAQVVGLVEGDGGDLPAALLRQLRNAVVEAGHGHRAVGVVQAGQDLAEHMQRVGHGPAVPARVQVGVGAPHRDVHRDQALGCQRQRRLARPPHRPVGRDDQVGREFGGVAGHERRQVRAADLLLALEEEPHVERQAALLVQERLGGLEHDVDRALVVGRAPAPHDVAVHAQLERGSLPLGQVAGGLHVVVPVHQDGRRPGGAEPLAPYHGVAAGGHQPGAGEGELPGQPLGRGGHGAGARVAANARDGHIVAELSQVTDIVVIPGQRGTGGLPGGLLADGGRAAGGGRPALRARHCRRQSRSSARSPRRTAAL
jgi:hypothetical protein